MKKIFFTMALLAICYFPSAAIDLTGILGKAGSAVGGVVEGLFTQSDITVSQMAGTWISSGSAVSFQSENALQKAGGNAAAGAIEGKLDPLFKQYGLTGATLNVDQDGKFTLKVKNISLKGTITKRSDGNFDFTFTPVGNVKIGTIKAYVEKPVSGLNVMFDANKLKSIITSVTKLTGNSLASTAGKLLENYDGLCVGFAFKGSGTGTTQNSTQTKEGNSQSVNIENALKSILGK